MKKTIIAFFTLICSIGVSAQQMSTIQGKFITDGSPKQMCIYKIENCECEELASTTVDKNGNFAFSIFPEEEGFYVIARNAMAHNFRYIFYLKPGDNLNFSISKDNYQLTGNNTAENQEMEKWHQAIYPIETKAVYFNLSRSTFHDFFPELTDLAPSLQKFPKAKTANRTFNAAFEDFKHYNLCDNALMFLFTPRTEQPQTSDYVDFYKNLHIADYTKSISLLNYPGGLNLLANIKMTNYRTDASITPEQMSTIFKQYSDDALKEIVNPIIKGEFVLSVAKTAKIYSVLMEYIEKNKHFLVNDEQKLRMSQILAKLDKNESGHAAPLFTLPDTNGKMHALADYRGKLVYIDFWATWCGPCKREIPFMTKLEEEYANNKDIVFMSISCDKETDKQKWLDMVKEKGMKGLQLFTGDLKAQVSEPYHINAIPKFVLIGKDGKLISGDAPRPSSDKIRPLIDSHLKSK